MYTTLRCLGKHMIQTNPSKFDERTERERGGGGGGGSFVENRNRRKIFGSRVCPI